MALRALNPKDTAVLIVEDNPNDAIIAARALRTLGIKNIFHAGTGEEAVHFLRSRHCDAVLVDFVLPGMNGLRLLKKLREIDPAASVIFVTGVRDEKIAVEALKNGAADYVSKDQLLTSGIINSLRNALRARGLAEVAEQAELLGEDEEVACRTALAEADWLASPADVRLPDPAPPTLSASEDIAAQDARDAFLRYLRACMSGRSFDAEEEGLVRLLVECGTGPLEVVAIFRSAVRVLQSDPRASRAEAAVRPIVCLTRVLVGLVDTYQGAISAQALVPRAA